MKLLLLIAIFCTFDAIEGKNITINHRGRFFLKNVNEARAIIASGLIRSLEILDITGTIGSLKVGPASNMYRMKWSVELETVAKKAIPSLRTQVDWCGNYKSGAYSGFFWKYDLVEAITKYFDDNHTGLNFASVIKKKLETFSSALETLVFIVWAIVSYPKTFPIPKDANIGPWEALYADRYEMGCAFDELAVCLMRQTNSTGTFYEDGVACTKCPTHCEYRENIDGTIDEGDLCVPPEAGSELDAQMQSMAEMQALIDSSNSYNWTLTIIALVIIHLLFK